jgi:hypothetical protein
MKSFTLFAAIAPLFAATLAFGADPEVTPYRPGVGSPALLSAPGYFELEAGYEYGKAEGLRADTYGLLLKYGVSDKLGLLIGVNPHQRLRLDGESVSGVSDAYVGVKYVNKLNDSTALGLQLVSTLPTGDRVFRSDDPNVSLTALAGFDYAGGFHSDVNLGVTRAGQGIAGVSRNTFSWSASIGRSLSGPVSGALEVSGSRQSGVGNATRFLGSLSYAVNKKLVLDAYVSRARASGVSGTTAGVGFTYLFAK